MEEKNRYNETKIYKLVDQINQYYYIGSTTNTLSRRIFEHKKQSKICPDRKIYKYFSNVGWENVKIILIEECNLENRNQQMREENKHIEMNIKDEKCLNSLHSFRDPEIYKKEKKEYMESYMRKYYQEHKKEMWECGKLYRQEHKEDKITCECGSVIKIICKSGHLRTKKHQQFISNQIIDK